MKRALAIIMLALVVSCSEDEGRDPATAKEDEAVMKAGARCGSFRMPWLRNIIKQAETDVNYKGEIYAIQYSGGVAFLYQRWISSCFGCLAYDCNGDQITITGSVMDEIISGATQDNVIYTSF